MLTVAVMRVDAPMRPMEDFVACPSRARIGFLILGSLVFLVVGLWIAGVLGGVPRPVPVRNIVVGWASAVLCGIAGLALMKRLFDTNEELRISAAGIRWTRWSDQVVPWPEIRDITVWRVKGQKMIVLHLRDASLFPGRGVLGLTARANRALSGGDMVISLTGTDQSFDDAISAITRLRP